MWGGPKAPAGVGGRGKGGTAGQRTSNPRLPDVGELNQGGWLGVEKVDGKVSFERNFLLSGGDLSV